MSIQTIDRFFERMADSSSEWLFYTGATIIFFEFIRQQKWLSALIIIMIGNLYISSFESTFGFLGSLGGDSFQESQNFNIMEAIFWLKTFYAQIKLNLNMRNILFYSITATILFFIIELFRKKYFFKYMKNANVAIPFAALIMIVAVSKATWSSIYLFIENTQAYENIKNNFTNNVPHAKANKNINVLLYMGESTSSLNMSLYGYHRKTTPRMDSASNTESSFIKFDNIFSTHTHTSPSLLEAFSIGLNVNDYTLPIYLRRRISIVDILNTSGIYTKLVSNQGRSGTWNQASSIVFRNSMSSIFSNEATVGNNESELKRPWDHELFSRHIKLEDLNAMTSSLVVFHSYAGHGPYDAQIPPSFRKPIDNSYGQLSPRAIAGSVKSVEQIEQYDSTIRYIDFAVSNAINVVKQSNQPWIFVYTADHGEAVFAKRGHDSSRFIHEMARVPFVLYFNDAAKNANPDLFQKYQSLASGFELSTLAQLPATLFDLLGVSLDSSVPMLPVIGSQALNSPILVRETAEGTTAVNIFREQANNSLIDRTDSSTSFFKASREFGVKGTAVCYHRSNTIAKAVRGSFVTNCLELDIVIEDNGEILVYHPPSENNTNLDLGKLLGAVRRNKELSFWLDGKNLDSGRTCNHLQAFLGEGGFANSSILIEFPTGSHLKAEELSSCVKKLKGSGNVYRSYYVPTGMAVDCAQDLALGRSFGAVDSCVRLKENLLEMKKTRLFTDISFDFEGFEAIKQVEIASEFKLNTWNIEPSDLNGLQLELFRMVILRTDDPNNL
jgi:glucan phosphoethanolaminetransferase (alkaline phosphatase superfamily)